MNYDKFAVMVGPVGDAARTWEADAIEKCGNDPAVAAAGLCYVCMVDLPVCHCV